MKRQSLNRTLVGILGGIALLIVGVLIGRAGRSPAPDAGMPARTATLPPTVQAQPPLTLALESPAPSAPPTASPAPSPSAPPPTVSPASPAPSPSPAASPTRDANRIPVMPDAELNDPIQMWDILLGQEVDSYIAPHSLEAVRDFYLETLAVEGWEWAYTDEGESLALTVPGPTLAQEFTRDGARLAIVAFSVAAESGEKTVFVMAARNVSSHELVTSYLGLIASELDLDSLTGSAVTPRAMRFTSSVLAFDHPSSWFPTRTLMLGYRTDADQDSYHYYLSRCADHDRVCFVNFALLTGAFFDVPITIRLYIGQSDVTLEAFDARRWAELVQGTRGALGTLRGVHRPEDLAAFDSLETIKLRLFSLRDGTPALQHIYRWRQAELSTPLLSTYTLFKRGDAMLEFRTDFTEEEWATYGLQIQEVLSSIELSP